MYLEWLEMKLDKEKGGNWVGKEEGKVMELVLVSFQENMVAKGSGARTVFDEGLMAWVNHIDEPFV